MSAAPGQAVIATPIPGIRLGVGCRAGAVVSIDFLSSEVPLHAPDPATLTLRAVQQIEAWFEGRRHTFDLPLAMAGTEYQRRVWRVLTELQFGERTSYGTLAGRLESGARAVAQACRANPIPLVVPCHRVVACSGIGGFMGANQGPFVGIKEWLLRHESGFRS